MTSDILHEFALGSPLSQRQINWLLARGVAPVFMARTYHEYMAPLNSDSIVFMGDSFEFARHLPGGEGVGAFTFLCFDEAGEPADIAAWRPPDLALWLGRVALLGQEQVYGMRLDHALHVHASVQDWLCAGREGVFIVDHAQAAHVLRNETLGVLDLQHARELRLKLTLPAPPVVVLDQAERAA